MKYIALHYAKIAGRTYTPGEIFAADIPPEKEERLLRLKAIRPLNEDEPVSAPPVKTHAAEGPDAAPEETQENGGEGEAGDGYAEAEEDAPEIDVMDGLVPPAPEPETPKEPGKPKAAGKSKAVPKPKAAAKPRTGKEKRT